MFCEFQQELARDVVGKIPEQLHSRLGEERSQIEIEGITMNDFEVCSSKSLPQEFHQALIFFDSEHARTGFEDELCKRPESRPNFDDVIVRRKVGLLNNPTRQVA